MHSQLLSQPPGHAHTHNIEKERRQNKTNRVAVSAEIPTETFSKSPIERVGYQTQELKEASPGTHRAHQLCHPDAQVFFNSIAAAAEKSGAAEKTETNRSSITQPVTNSFFCVFAMRVSVFLEGILECIYARRRIKRGETTAITNRLRCGAQGVRCFCLIC